MLTLRVASRVPGSTDNQGKINTLRGYQILFADICRDIPRVVDPVSAAATITTQHQQNNPFLGRHFVTSARRCMGSSGSPTDTPETASTMRSPIAPIETICVVAFLESAAFSRQNTAPDCRTQVFTRNDGSIFRQNHRNLDARRHAWLHDCGIDLVELNDCLKNLFCEAKFFRLATLVNDETRPPTLKSGQGIESDRCIACHALANCIPYRRRSQQPACWSRSGRLATSIPWKRVSPG